MSYSCILRIIVLFSAIPLHKTIFLKSKCDTNALNLYLVSDLQNLTDLKITHMKSFIEFFISQKDHPQDFNITIYDPLNNKTLINFGQKDSSEILKSVDELKEWTSKNASFESSHQNLLLAIDNTLANKADGDFIIAFFIGCFGNCAETFKTFDDLATSFEEKQLFTFLYSSAMEEPMEFQYTDYYINIPIDLKVQHTLHIESILKNKVCLQCPVGWFLYQNENNERSSCYFFKEKKTKGNDVVKECEQKNARLPSIETNHELLFIKELFSNKSSKFEVDHAKKFDTFIGLLRQRHATGSRLVWNTLRPFLLRCDIKDSKNKSNKLHLFTLSFHSNDANNKTVTSNDCSINVKSRTKRVNFLLCEKETEVKCSHIVNLLQNIKENHVQKVLNNVKFMRANNLFSATMKFDKKNVSTQHFFNLLFDCGDDFTLLPYQLVCDDSLDCQNGRDEEYCYEHLPDQKKKSFFCRNPNLKLRFGATYSIPRRAICDGITDCPDNSDEMNCKECMDATCEDGTCVPKHWLSSEGEVCLFNTSDNIYFYLNASEPTKTLFPDDESMHEVVLCGVDTEDSHVRQDWAPRCIYLRGQDQNPVGCPENAHLSNCDIFRCPTGFLKCPNSYCIPVHYLNDGTFDCVYGEDELENYNDVKNSLNTIDREDNFSHYQIPPDYFACKDSKIILHPLNVCDGFPQCPREEDEMMCNGTCPMGFSCLAGGVGVENISQTGIFLSLNIFDIKTKFLNISYVNLSMVNKPYILPNLLSLQAAFCNLKTIDNLFVQNTVIYSLYSLNFSGNDIQEIKSNGILRNLPNLRFLDLSHNRALSALRYGSIRSQKLQSLDLSYTRIAELYLRVFLLKPSPLRKLNLQGTKISKVGFIHTLDFFDIRDTQLSDQSVFNLLKEITISSDLFTDNFKYCCPQVVGTGIPKHTCHAPDDAFSTCSDLMGDSFKRSLLWIVAVLSLVGNVGVIVYRLLSDKAAFQVGYGFFVVNLAIADLLMAIYLLTIAIMDTLYRGNYVIYEKSWRESRLCTAAGVISTMSNESSILFVFLITFDRLLVIRFPYGNYRFSKPTIIAAVVTAWLLSCGLSVTPVFFPHWGMYSSNAICMGLPNDTRNDGMYFGISVYIGFNCLLFLLITAGQVVIFHTLFANTTIAHKSTARRAQDFKVARQLFLVAISNFIFWFPLCVVGMLAVTGHEVNNNTLSWIAIFVLPLNSSINPLIYTAPLLHAKWVAFKLRATDTGIELREIREPAERK